MGTRGLVIDSGTVAAWTLVSRITGFGRVATMAAVLGPTYFGNLFQAAALLPTMIFALLGGTMIAAQLVPALVNSADRQDRHSVQRVASGFLGMIILALACVVAVAVALAPVLLSLITAAVDDPHIRAQQRQLGWPLLLMLLPQILLYCIAAVGMAVQQAYGRFGIAAAAPALENIGIIAVLCFSALIFGVGSDLNAVTMPNLLLLGLGATGAVAIHATAQWLGAFRLGIALVPWAGWRHREIRRMIQNAFASSGYAALYNLVSLGILVVSGRVAGGVSAFQIGQNFAYLPVALGAIPLSAAQLPRLSRRFNERDMSGFQESFVRNLALTRFIVLPAGLLLLALSNTLARAVAFGEMSTVAGTALIAACIGSLGPGVLGEAMIAVSTSAFYARGDALTPFRAIALRTAVALGGIVLAWGMLNGIAMLWTVGLAVSAANLVSAGYLKRCISITLPRTPDNRGSSIVGELAACAIAIVPSLTIAMWFQGSLAGHYETIAVAAVLIAITGVLYLGIQQLRGSLELAMLSAEIWRPK
jgi:putative peptidoglycan lipid II flippase